MTKYKVFMVAPYGWWAEVEAENKSEARRKAKSGEYEPLETGNLVDGKTRITKIEELK